MLRTIGIAITVFVCGWVLMGLEILGGRMLPSHFGSGIHVWGSVISTFLAALSVGYFAGGFLSQWWPSGWGLATVILAAAISIVPVALWDRPVSEFLADLELEDRWGALLAAAVFFFVPSALLGVVSPYAVRLTARSVSSVGASAGVLYAISTVGSFLGCLMTAFYFILWAGIRANLLVSAAVLAATAVWLAVTWRLGRPATTEE